jgi:hypothetical protein
MYFLLKKMYEFEFVKQHKPILQIPKVDGITNVAHRVEREPMRR